MQKMQDVNIASLTPLPPPQAIKVELPASENILKTVFEARETIKRILLKQDPRLLVIVGPCSIHDPEGALDYARRLATLRKEFEDQLFILMRVYFEKPRTTIGWKGLINDPDLDGSCDIHAGIRLGRKLMMQIIDLGLPAATEFLDPIIPQYISDLVSWAAIGARTTESQTHRELASGLSMPVGFKNGTDGSLTVAINAMHSARQPHSFLGIDPSGVTCVVKTNGNPWGHIVLRGGSKRTNYDPESINDTAKRLTESGLSPAIMVDCSHANSGKSPAQQEVVWRSVVEQRVHGNDNIIGLMLESYLEQGNQPFPQPREKLRYGVSITDSCLSWTSTVPLLQFASEIMREQLGAKHL